MTSNKVSEGNSSATVRALESYVKLVRAANAVMASVHWPLRQHGLTVSQFGALEALFHLGPLTPGELGRKILRSGGNMTLVIDNLERRELVRRERLAEDRRRWLVRLTGEGRRLIEAVFPSHARRIAAAMGTLKAKEQDELGRLCRTLGRAAMEKGTKHESGNV